LRSGYADRRTAIIASAPPVPLSHSPQVHRHGLGRPPRGSATRCFRDPGYAAHPLLVQHDIDPPTGIDWAVFSMSFGNFALSTSRNAQARLYRCRLGRTRRCLSTTCRCRIKARSVFNESVRAWAGTMRSTVSGFATPRGRRHLHSWRSNAASSAEEGVIVTRTGFIVRDRPEFQLRLIFHRLP